MAGSHNSVYQNCSVQKQATKTWWFCICNICSAKLYLYKIMHQAMWNTAESINDTDLCSNALNELCAKTILNTIRMDYVIVVSLTNRVYPGWYSEIWPLVRNGKWSYKPALQMIDFQKLHCL